MMAALMQPFRLLVIAAALVLMIASLGYLMLSPDRKYRETPVQFTLGSEQLIDFKVTQACSHEIGLGFRSLDGDQARIDSVFGSGFKNVNLPARYRLTLHNLDGERIFHQRVIGGSGLPMRYGPDPIKFIAGTVFLPEGHYTLSLHVDELYSRFEGLGAFVFAQHIPKTRCGSMKDPS